MIVPILNLVLNRLKGVLLWVLGVVRRAFCCFRRRRRPSVDSVPLTEIGVVPNHHPPTYGEHQSWNNWEDTPDCVVTEQKSQPNSIQEHIDLYRQQKLASTLGLNSNGKEEDPDYFQDMVPRLTKQKRILLKKPDVVDINMANARLKMDPQATGIVGGDELKEWEESCGWDDEVRDCEEAADLILREQRRLDRERKAAEKLQKRLEKQGRPLPLGARLS